MNTIDDLRLKVLDGKEISREDALYLLQRETQNDILELIRSAGEITKHFHGRRAGLCSIINAKSGLCAEDCLFCAQSVRFKTNVRRYPLINPTVICEKAEQASARGSHEFCIVTSGASLTEREFGELLDIVSAVRAHASIQIDVSVGFLSFERAERLKKAGVTRVNHNIQSSSQFYSRIVTTHSYDDRLATLGALERAGLEICCGVILGLGETLTDRIDAALKIRKFRPACVPINLLDPRPGTPLAQSSPLEPSEIIKTIATYRFMLPETSLRLAGGRQVQLGSFQRQALEAGINGLIMGEYLTTKGSSIFEDFALLAEAGFKHESIVMGKTGLKA